MIVSSANMQQTSLSLTGEVPPITQDPDYPELIRELADVVERKLKDRGIDEKDAQAVAEDAAEHVRERFGGQPLYWAKGETMRQRRRREAMWEMFNGRNYAEVSKAFGVCLQQAYRQIAIMRAEERARRQGRLFDPDDAPVGTGETSNRQ